jgi:ketosteroid isomerase-like protein
VAQEILDSLREGYRAFRERDIDGVLSLVDPEVEVEIFTGRPDTAGRVYRGHEGFVQNFSELMEVFEDLDLEPVETVDAGERVLVGVRVTGTGRASGVAVETMIYHVWTSREGLATRLEIYSERGAAVSALGD